MPVPLDIPPAIIQPAPSGIVARHQEFLKCGTIWINSFIRVATAAYTIDNAVWLDGSADYFSYTPSAGDADLWTVSLWFKRPELDATHYLFSASAGASSDTAIFLNSSNELILNVRTGSTNYQWVSSQLFRDIPAWYNLVVQANFNDATAGDRWKVYLNGIEITDWSTQDTVPQANSDWGTAVQHEIGKDARGTSYFNGYIAEFCYLDGVNQAYTDFGEFDSNGVWVPKDLSGLSPGTSGGLWQFDGTITSTVTDNSTNSNDWTSNSITAAQQVTDTPTNNLLTWNPLHNQQSAGTFTEGSKTYTYTSTTRTLCPVTHAFPKTGKWVVALNYSATTSQDFYMGLLDYNDANFGDAAGSNENVDPDTVNYSNGTNYVPGNVTSSTPVDTADELWIAVDMDNDQMWQGIYDDSAAAMVWFDGAGGTTGDPGAGSNPTHSTLGMENPVLTAANRDSVTLTILCSDEVTGTVPSGFTYMDGAGNFPTAAVPDPDEEFQVILDDGDGIESAISSAVTALGSPDYVVAIKDRDTDADAWAWRFSADGSNEHRIDDTDDTYGAVSSFSGSETHAACLFKLNGDAKIRAGSVAHTNGGGDTSVSFTSTGTARQLIILFPTQSGGAGVPVYHPDLTSGDLIYLTDTSAETTDAAIKNVTATGFDIDDGEATDTYYYLVIPEIAGFCDLFTYTGNGNADGPAVYNGLRPHAGFTKKTNDVSGWPWHDYQRSPYNVSEQTLYLNKDNAETDPSTEDIDFLATGFKIRATTAARNTSAATYVGMMIGRPTGGSNVAPAGAV